MIGVYFIGLAFALHSAVAQDLFLASEPQAPWVPECAPLNWIKHDMGSGHWILNYTDTSWGKYLTFLGMDKSHFPEEFNASDIHQYDFFDRTFIMNHTIPSINFHLLYEASLEDRWEKNPYPHVTPSGLDPNASVDLTTFKNTFERPGKPHPDSCWAMRTDMPVQKNISGVMKEFIVTFWRELTSPIDMRCTLHVWDAASKKVIDPWASEMQDSKPFPGYSYRYFRKTVQSFADAVTRLPCIPTGLRNGTFFC